MKFDEGTWISCANKTCAICLPRVLKILFGRGKCDESMSRGSNLGNFDGIRVGAAVWCDGVWRRIFDISCVLDYQSVVRVQDR